MPAQGASAVLLPVTATAGAQGNATATLTGFTGYLFQIDQLSISCSPESPGQFRLFQNGEYIVGSGLANGDTADGTPIFVPGAATLTFKWTGISPGSVCECIVQGQKIKIGPGVSF